MQQEEKFQVGFPCTQKLIHNKKIQQANSIYACSSSGISKKNFIYVCINAYTAIYMNILYTYSDRQKTEKIHNNANMRNRHTVNGIGERVEEWGWSRQKI